VKQRYLKEAIQEVEASGLCSSFPELLDAEKVLNLPGEEFEEFSRLMRSVLEPTRLKILYLLRQTSLPTCVIAHLLDQDRTLISHHLARLVELNLVEVKRVRRFSVYSLTERGSALLDGILELLSDLSGISPPER